MFYSTFFRACFNKIGVEMVVINPIITIFEKISILIIPDL